jgi:hypothetical protein
MQLRVLDPSNDVVLITATDVIKVATDFVQVQCEMLWLFAKC